MKVAWTDKALFRLQQLHDYIAADQPENARNFVDRLTIRAASIGGQPRIGRIVSRYGRDDIREIHEGAYRIVYRILPERIDILTVRHGARLMPGRIRDL